MAFANLHVILVEPSHPGNIGSTARAMKTMGLQRLSLIQPKCFPHPDALSLAAGADDILTQCAVYDTLPEALESAQFVIGTSARKRHLHHKIHTPESAADYCLSHCPEGEIAILFGNERRGLTNEQLEQCHAQLSIPTHSDYKSINLAQAVQIVCYVFARTFHNQPTLKTAQHDQPASYRELHHFYQHLDQTLDALGFFQRPNKQPTQTKLHHIFNRCELKQTEVAMLRGLLSSLNKGSQLK